MTPQTLARLVVVSSVLLLPTLAWAQAADTASVAGVVRDASGAVLPGVFVFAGYFGVHLSQHVFTQHFHYGVETHRVGAKAGITSSENSASERSDSSSVMSPNANQDRM